MNRQSIDCRAYIIRAAAYISEWEIVYHEILATSDCFVQITTSKISSRERDLHHDLSGGIANEFQESVNKVYTFIESRENPYKAKGNVKLHHSIIPPEIASKLLNVYKL